MKTTYAHENGQGTTPVVVEELGGGRYRVAIGEQLVELDVRQVGPGEYHVIDGEQAHDLLVQAGAPGSPRLVHSGGRSFPIMLLDEQQVARQALAPGNRPGARGSDGVVSIRAPMPGKVVKTLVRAGEKVSSGQGVIVIEAMKMENELRAPIEGSIKELRVAEGANVEAGEALVLIE